MRGQYFLWIGLSVIFLLSCSGAGKNKEEFANKELKTYMQSTLAPLDLLNRTIQYLEYYRAYNLSIRDGARGLIVTEWVDDSVAERHRVTIRVNEDIQGSILTAHFERQSSEDGHSWKEEASGRQAESHLIAELETYLKSSAPQPQR
ncbi:MAG: hypothetical protein COV44_06110 [Deltaproteobacteria bacterium CG11_big_fil_rev_8_21_14_0_20_45_16]|nr:MAG: hypothetical protein COV44_06110 [Deltaproteobacteria bacterium CG11_big_fil_rev_8_21_14_0_20_45_16]